MRVLDLFCGAGGAGAGYARNGFEVVGVDINRQPRYPFTFIHADAMEVDLDGFDLIHASPPCQFYSAMSQCRPGLAARYPNLIGPVRERLSQTGKPYVIENVVGAPLQSPIMLCGRMFGLRLYRHRLFETNFTVTQPAHMKHDIPTSKAGHWKPGTIMSVAGHVAPIAVARASMGIGWMRRDELVEAIPPVYTEYIGTGLKES